MEIWKDIPGCTGYEASSLGRIRSKQKGRILSSSLNSKGYSLTTISRHGSPCRALVHRLVMAAFHGKSELQVNHIDGHKTNNVLSNLEYVSAKQNVRHAMTVLGISYGGDRRRIMEVEA